jgi:hypothetical protein
LTTTGVTAIASMSEFLLDILRSGRGTVCALALVLFLCAWLGVRLAKLRQGGLPTDWLLVSCNGADRFARPDQVIAEAPRLLLEYNPSRAFARLVRQGGVRLCAVCPGREPVELHRWEQALLPWQVNHKQTVELPPFLSWKLHSPVSLRLERQGRLLEERPLAVLERSTLLASLRHLLSPPIFAHAAAWESRWVSSEHYHDGLPSLALTVEVNSKAGPEFAQVMNVLGVPVELVLSDEEAAGNPVLTSRETVIRFPERRWKWRQEFRPADLLGGTVTRKVVATLRIGGWALPGQALFQVHTLHQAQRLAIKEVGLGARPEAVGLFTEDQHGLQHRRCFLSSEPAFLALKVAAPKVDWVQLTGLPEIPVPVALGIDSSSQQAPPRNCAAVLSLKPGQSNFVQLDLGKLAREFQLDHGRKYRLTLALPSGATVTTKFVFFDETALRQQVQANLCRTLRVSRCRFYVPVELPSGEGEPLLDWVESPYLPAGIQRFVVALTMSATGLHRLMPQAQCRLDLSFLNSNGRIHGARSLDCLITKELAQGRKDLLIEFALDRQRNRLRPGNYAIELSALDRAFHREEVAVRSREDIAGQVQVEGFQLSVAGGSGAVEQSGQELQVPAGFGVVGRVKVSLRGPVPLLLESHLRLRLAGKSVANVEHLLYGSHSGPVVMELALGPEALPAQRTAAEARLEFYVEGELLGALSPLRLTRVVESYADSEGALSQTRLPPGWDAELDGIMRQAGAA